MVDIMEPEGAVICAAEEKEGSMYRYLFGSSAVCTSNQVLSRHPERDGAGVRQ